MVVAPHTTDHAASLWALGIEHQQLHQQIEALALQLDSDDADPGAITAELEALLAADLDQQQALERKADAYCWVIDNLQAMAAYRRQQAERLLELADADLRKAQRLQETLITVLTRLSPDSTAFSLPNHRIRAHRSQAVVIDDEQALPQAFFRVKTTATPDKTAIKAAIKAGEQVPGSRLETRCSWSIR